MAAIIRVRKGGGTADAYNDFTDRVPFPEFIGVNSVNNGGAAQGEFTVDDDANAIPSTAFDNNLPAHARVEIYDDGPGFDCYLAYGRIDRKDAARGTEVFGPARQWKVTYGDANEDLHGITLTSDWVRGAETDVTRFTAAMTAFCNGSPRFTTDLEQHLIASSPTTSMPAKTYPAGTILTEILNDCATVAGKVYGVVIHHQSSASHMCALYIDETDHTTFASTLRISDDEDDINITSEVVADPPAIVREKSAEDYGASLELQEFVVEGGGDDMLIAFVATRGAQTCTGVNYIPDTAIAGTTEAFTKIGSTVEIGSPAIRVTAWKLHEPSASVQESGGDFTLSLPGTNSAASMYLYYLSGVTSSTVVSASDSDAGTTVASDVSTATDGHILLDAVAWAATHGTTDSATPGSGQTSDGLTGDDPGAGAFGDPDTILATSHMDASDDDTTMSWSVSSSANFTGAVHIAVGVLGVPSVSPTYPPIWAQGAASIEEGQHLASKVVSRHSTGVVIADGGTAITDAYEYWAVPYYDAASTNAAQATARANAFLGDLNKEHVTHQVTIKMAASQLDLVSAGQSIQIKAAAAMGGQYLGTFQTRRVIQLKWQPIAPDSDGDGRAYLAHMQLDRPMRISAPGAGPGSQGQPTARAVVGDITDHGDLDGLADDDHTAYIAHSDISPGEGFLRKTGSGAYTAHKSNMAASTAPTVNEDTGDGYTIGSRWLDTTNDKEYVALDVSSGAAVWKETTASGAGSSIVVQEDGSTEGTATVLNFSTNLNLSYSGGTATITADAAATATFVGCRVYNVGDELIDTAGVAEVLHYNTEEYDTDAIHSTSTGTSKFTVPSGKGGKWRLQAAVFLPSGSAQNQLRLRKNGTTDLDPAFRTNQHASLSVTALLDCTVLLAAGDYLEIMCSFTANNINVGHDSVSSAYNFAEFTLMGA